MGKVLKRLLLWTLWTAPVNLYLFFLRPQMLKWGTRLGESQRRLPGDDFVPTPNLQATRAIDIDAPAEVVWAWIAQMGRESTGWYGIDALDNNGVPSATYLRQDLPPLQVGAEMDKGLQVLAVEPQRALVFGGSDVPLGPGARADLSVTCLLEAHDGQTRLLMRTRGAFQGMAGLLYGRLVFEWLDFARVMRQLSGIRQRAEDSAWPVEIAIPAGEQDAPRQ